MKLNRDKLRAAVKKAKERSSSGQFRFLKKDGTTALRILTYKDAAGDVVFAQEYPQWVPEHGDFKDSMLDRSVFGKPCAVKRLIANCRKAGMESPYRLRMQYIVNAIDINDKQAGVQQWTIPTSVWEQIAGFLIDDEYADALDPKTGLAFRITRSGSGLDTEYTVVAGRKAIAVTAKQQKEAKDPLDLLTDIGLDGQCEHLGVEIEDLWPDGAPKDTVKKKVEDDDEEEEEWEDEEEEEEEDEEPDDDDGEEDEEEEYEDDEEEEEEEEPDEDEEEEEDDDEEEEEPPVKRRQTKGKVSLESLTKAASRAASKKKKTTTKKKTTRRRR